ncbi:TIGR04438 family Trp-rich protein [Inhella gelatinilytica]|uniref:TIGR04438 family Trp-rich protein n=1 Tax=Inhella gelatinilytica TaxID=2795030 RepID=A0A931IVD8_9BURK|nr:TIGR04438 family Trp-rich protein [Inhella gelatinilytica]MBH9552864.1 TIGR04438 family Trp-rich protein [Inhella gelatinilytica]
MALVLLAVVLILLKFLEIGPVAGWSWVWVLSPLAGAVAWWAWADATGYTQRKAMDKLDERKEERRRKVMAALGTDKTKR